MKVWQTVSKSSGRRLTAMTFPQREESGVSLLARAPISRRTVSREMMT